MNRERIAVVGIGLVYPDADSPDELWTNVLAGRRAFRDIPDERTRLSDYWSADPQAPDAFYSRKAAVLRGYEFDRVRHRISAATFRATDMTHWLALDVADRALADAGFPGGEGLPARTTGAVVGNTLTGEFTRAGLMRLRWPYVRRTVADQLRASGWDPPAIDGFLADLEPRYKAPFPVPDEDSLAGGLANTIAGRICNYFNLGGGGYTVDGACSSSLLSVVNAANALTTGDLDVALAGGVDLSIDPFELIGFARTGALATREMRVYDADSNGFWPGEGSGMVVLMRESDARAQGRRIYACITGYGVSSDGHGGITRPEVEGHRDAIARAYARAGYPVDSVGYFEGHGTGTAVGDATEIAAIAGSLRPRSDGTRAALGSVKANIGHTKAAAGIAGLIKATLAVHHRTIPPVTGQTEPHPVLADVADRLHTPHEAAPWAEGTAIRAGVSAMGFGGINTHIALEQADPADTARPSPTARVRDLVRGRQDAEVLLLGGTDADELAADARRLLTALAGAALCELADVAATSARHHGGAEFRAAVVARTPEEAVTRLDAVVDRLTAGPSPTTLERVAPGAFVGRRRDDARVAFVFPGQGTGHGHVGAGLRRFGHRALPAPAGDGHDDGTATVQPRVVARSLDSLDALERCGIAGDIAVGHSLGEITALAWAGVFTADQALRVATRRGALMDELAPRDGAMAVLYADAETAERLLAGTSARISGYNAPAVVTVAGRQDDVDRVVEAAARADVATAPLAVRHAFHTEDFARAAEALGEYLAGEQVQAPQRPVRSTVDGSTIDARTDLAAYLSAQIVRPVRFSDAVQELDGAELVVEVGPGHALGGLVAATLPGTVVTRTDSDSPSLEPFLECVAAAHALGRDIKTGALVDGRAVKPFDLDTRPVFLANPCEAAPELGFEPSVTAVPAPGVPASEPAGTSSRPGTGPGPDDGTGAAASPDAGGTDPASVSTLELVRRSIAAKVELPLEMIEAGTRPLDELHLSSITIAQITNDVIRSQGRPPLSGVPAFATATVGEIAEMLDAAADTEPSGGPDDAAEAPGAEPWVHAFAIRHLPADPLPAPPPGQSRWTRLGAAREDTDRLLARLSATDGAPGVLVDTRGLPLTDSAARADELISRLRETRTAREPVRVVALHHGPGGLAGLLKSVRLEHPDISVTVVTVAPDADLTASVIDSVAADTTASGFLEVGYDAAGRRHVPRLDMVPPAAADDAPLGDTDVLLATGGAKGITAEACLDLARRYGIAVAMLGRATADDDAVRTTLDRMTSAGVRHHYVAADVTDPDAVAAAVTEIESALGTVTAVLHGAGVNRPEPTLDLTPDRLRAAVAPKVDGLRHVLAAVDLDRVRHVVGFGSIIGRAGLPGEGHYALANDWMTAELTALAAERPGIRVRSLEWSVWSGTGMGENLGVVELLKQQGIEPVDTDRGLAQLRRAVSTPDFPVTALVCSRVGSLPTLGFLRRELPLRRFTERVVVDYPGVELVTEAELTARTDPYLLDHRFEGELLLPGVIGLEAMAQAATALSGVSPSRVSGVALERPVVVPPEAPEKVRVCAVTRLDGSVAVTLRTAATGFAADHFRAVFHFGDAPAPDLVASGDRTSPIELDPIADLYGGVLFQDGRFRRITAYHRVTARHASADLSAESDRPWFEGHLPQALLLGDPGSRDALMHALQCCVPHGVLLPQGVDEIVLGPGRREGTLRMDAREIDAEDGTYTYDVTVRDTAGLLVEHWSRLRLRSVRAVPSAQIAWPHAFLGPYLQRRAEEHLGGSWAVAVEPHGDRPPASVAARQAGTALAVRRALGEPLTISYRPDGRPECGPDHLLSASHGADCTTVVVGDEGLARLAVDVELVEPRPEETWLGLLDSVNLATAARVAADLGEDLDTAATRIWSVLECLRKTGQVTSSVHAGAPLGDSWTEFTVGRDRVASWAGRDLAGRRITAAVLRGDE
ncbi:type I polyketide synthase [Myceligenerans xiligouense]|uniref:Enediyne polyketide synthase n=1 Tax=Myceligenerans xiligouense TaxID=253184 RepID=A0A3N4ZII0_9MICO|nr:type I polyketide synthase [Myceligenerans xiligouense]RPF19721.1 enediyne polyketide synthase [Myceligenerans xiligouense]